MTTLAYSTRVCAGFLKNGPGISFSRTQAPLCRLLNIDAPSLPPFPDLHDYPYETPISNRVMQLRQGVRFGQQQVEIRTCGTLFEKWRQERRYWRVSPVAVPFTVDYLDTKPMDSRDDGQPTVVILHGTPGHYDNFTKLTTYLHRHGVRVISPCFPGISTYRMGNFRHTPEEKCEFVKDFLYAINSPRVDMLICHSSSLFPGVLLCKEKKYPIRSLALLNPTAYETPRVIKPYNLIRLIMRAFEFPVATSMASLFGALAVMSKPQLKGDSYTDHFLSAFTIIAAEPPKRECEFQELTRENFPVFLAFSENDKLIRKRALYKMAEMMVKASDVQQYDGSGRLVHKGGSNPTKRVLSFKEGTHFVFQKHPDTVAEEVRSFLFKNLEKR